MFSRVSTRLLTDTFIERLQMQTRRLAELQEQISSGRRLSQPDQDPSDFVELRLNEEQTARLAAFRLNITTANARLNQSVAALQDVNLILRRANEIALEANNAGVDAAAREAYAVELDGLIEQLLKAANTQVGDEYIFSGTAVDSKPFHVAATDPEGRPTAIEYRGG
ncbi:MAG: flagellar hook-associated protein FlgL, partial [Gemmataceae bacterium]|nr:flagellar hook-associated protein FlgL [Gemmataceae bacterium]